jgi:hypothetical protein
MPAMPDMKPDMKPDMSDMKPDKKRAMPLLFQSMVLVLKILPTASCQQEDQC